MNKKNRKEFLKELQGPVFIREDNQQFQIHTYTLPLFQRQSEAQALFHRLNNLDNGIVLTHSDFNSRQNYYKNTTQKNFYRELRRKSWTYKELPYRMYDDVKEESFFNRIIHLFGGSNQEGIQNKYFTHTNNVVLDWLRTYIDSTEQSSSIKKLGVVVSHLDKIGLPEALARHNYKETKLINNNYYI